MAELLIVHVIDTSEGIGEDKKANLFKVPDKLQNTPDVNEEGLYSGLFICKMIVENCGGSIDVYSNGPKQGSTLVFSMNMRIYQAKRFDKIKV